MSAKELTFSEPVELTDAETDAVTGGCVIGPCWADCASNPAELFWDRPSAGIA